MRMNKREFTAFPNLVWRKGENCWYDDNEPWPRAQCIADVNVLHEAYELSCLIKIYFFTLLLFSFKKFEDSRMRCITLESYNV